MRGTRPHVFPHMQFLTLTPFSSGRPWLLAWQIVVGPGRSGEICPQDGEECTLCPEPTPALPRLQLS